MAGEEGDSELRDLVAQTLETQGVLGKIRAQLRASVFLALEKDNKDKPNNLANHRFNSFMQTEDGHLTAGLVREFLQFFDLDFTCSVFDPESNVLKHFNGREKLATDTGLSSTTDSPLLLQLLKRARSTQSLSATGTSHPTPTSSIATGTSHPPPTSSSSLVAPPTLPVISLSTTASIDPPTPSQSLSRHTTTLPPLTESSKLVTATNPTLFTMVPSSSSTGSVMSTTGTVPVSSIGSTRDTHESTVQSKSILTSGTNQSLVKGEAVKTASGLQGDKAGVKDGSQSGDDTDTETIPSQKWDTTDHSLSPNSTSAVDEFDYTEHIQ